MADLNKQALEMWNAMKPMVDREIDQQTKGAVQRIKAKVTTAPSLVTKKIGVTEPFGDQYFIPFTTNLSTAKVGDVVWVEYMYGATNAFASMYASADTKNWTVGGVLDVVQRRCYATLSSAGWYRVMQTGDVAGTIIDFRIGRPYDANPAEAHKISFYTVGGGKSAFLDETSDTNTLCVDKIRATYGGGFMYFDVHYNTSSANEVLVYFDVYGKGQANGTSIAMGLASVADAPAGETVLTTHNFSANASPVQTANVSDVLRSGTFTPSDNTLDYTATAPCWFYGSFLMQANSRGITHIEVNNVRVYDFDLSASLGHQYCFVPVPLQKGDRLYVYISSNDNSTYKIIAMR